MLKYLHIENIAIIESSDIELVSGFNVLTGETGAGKSIIIDSINAVLGERTYKEIIRHSADKALVSAIFGNLSEACVRALSEYGITPDEDGNISVQRVLSQTGNGSIRINGQLTTAQVLRDVAKYLVNIHGQHDSQMLLKPENHYVYLDLIAGNEKQREEYTAAFKEFTDIRRQIKALETDDDQKAIRIDLLKFQIEEIENAAINIGEIEELKKKREIFQNADAVIKRLNESIFAINGDIDSDGAMGLTRSALNYIEKANVEALGGAANSLNNAMSLLDETTEQIRKYISDFNYSKEEVEKTNDRLDLLHSIVVKYGNSEEKTLEYLDKAKEELELIEFGDQKLEELENELVLAQERLVKAGAELTASRREAAKGFENKVCEALSFMDMNSVQFIVDINESKYSKTGKDSIEFLISANAGETVKPLYKVASGGELSRTMLAIKSIIADKDNVDTLIFDEIDTGISGRAASKVAVQLRKLSGIRQVICVTHLAQIAAAAEGHFLIEKSVKDGKTYTNVTLLNEDDRIKEIARIMSGTNLTENTISSAKELIDRSKI
ncbi:MAG: DNA repair protein RecN [Clostridia bacterium]|nr:DNA repair protein RecN [Clostridia bacterium]